MNSDLIMHLTEEGIVEIATEEFLTMQDHWHLRNFTSKFVESPYPFIKEATRHIEELDIDSFDIINIMMNPVKWAAVFPAIVAHLSSQKEISPGNAVNRDGSIWKIEAVFHLLTPFIPGRKVTFLRGCKKVEDDLMAIVDVSVINEGDNARRFPSGLLVKRLEQGKSKVIWIERAEYHSNTIGESSFKTLMQGASGGFSGYKFLCMLKHRGASFPEGHINNPADFSRMAARMVKGFCRVVSDIPGRAWNVILAEEDKRFMIYRTEKVQVAALTTSFTLPFPAKLVFERIQELHVENQLLSEHALPLKLFKEYPFGIKFFNYGTLNIHLRFSQSCVLDEDLMSILVYSNDIPVGENLEVKTSGFAVQSFGLNESLLTVHMVHNECEKLEECSYGTLLESLKLAAGKLTQKISSSF